MGTFACASYFYGGYVAVEGSLSRFSLSLLHLVIRQWVERFVLLSVENAYIDDVTVYVRPTINFIYNGRFGQPITQEELKKIPENIRKVILSYYESSGRCLPNHGDLFGNIVFLLPIIIISHILNVSPESFGFLTFFLPSTIAIVFYPIPYLIMAWLIGDGLRNRVVLYGLVACAIFISPYTNPAEPYNVVAMGSVSLLIAYLRYRSLAYIFWSLLLALMAFFMKYRAAPVLFTIPMVLFILRDPNRFRALGLMLLLWLPVQTLWSWHVYKYTCKWTLTNPSDIYAATPCEGIDEYCFSIRECYNYFRVYSGRLEVKLAIPHSTYYHPDGLLWYMKGYTYKGQPSKPFPRFLEEDTALYARYMQLINLNYKQLATITDEKILILYGYYFIAQAKLLMLETDKNYPWLPVYRFFRVLRDNIFHPPVAGFPDERRGRYPKWVRDSYFFYTSFYVAVSYLIGFLSGLVILWKWLRGRLREEGLSYAVALVVAGWSLVAVAALTGHSEWRYFFPSAPLLLMVGVLVAAKLLRRNKSSPT